MEDKNKLAQSIKNGLKQEDYVVDIVDNGETAERQILMNKDAYDLILLDIMLPGKDSLQLSKDLREKKFTAPILMLTARDTKQDIVLGLSTGADD